MSAKICFMCDDALSCSSPEAKSYSENGIPPCSECLIEMMEADQEVKDALDECEEDE